MVCMLPLKRIIGMVALQAPPPYPRPASASACFR
jgi:hypothetical protein